MRKTVTLIPGDGVGPEVVNATRRIIDASGVEIRWEVCEAGSAVFKRGLSSGIPQETIDSIARNRVALKGPLETPIGYGEKSANVTLRKIFDTYGNIRPIRHFEGIPTPFSGHKIDFAIVRENLEDLYAGIEYRLSPTVSQALKIISRQGCERIVHLAFSYARSQGKKKVHCATKANILKLTEGLLKHVFEEIAPQYPDIEASHLVVDNCAHQMIRFPEKFDVIVMSNMNGDILSDMASGLIGGLGFAPGANIGKEVCIFEEVHGSAPRHKGLNRINPTAFLLSGVMMLRHIGEGICANRIENALALTFQQKLGTQDVFGENQGLSTQAFTEAVIRNLDCSSSLPIPSSQNSLFTTLHTSNNPSLSSDATKKNWQKKGVDVFLRSNGLVKDLDTHLKDATEGTSLQFIFLDNRGFIVSPPPTRLPDCVDTWRARFLASEEIPEITDDEIFTLLKKISSVASWSQVTPLFWEEGQPTFTKAQGE